MRQLFSLVPVLVFGLVLMIVGWRDVRKRAAGRKQAPPTSIAR